MTLPASLEKRLAIPAIVAPMFLVSGPDLVVSCCEAGLLGTFPALNQRTSQGFGEWLDEIEERLAPMPGAAPFGVNLITMHPQLMELIAVCAKHQVGHVVLAGGLPPKGSIEAIKEMGAKVVCFAPALTLAKKFIRSGVDALVIEGMEAGGHIGPVATSVLAQMWQKQPPDDASVATT